MDIPITSAVDHSTKKTKFREQGEDGDNPLPPSFADIVMKMQARSENVLFGKTEDWDLEEDDVIFRDEEPMPFIAFSNRVHERLAHPWEHSVVVKILGRNLGYRVLLTRLKSIWSATKGFTVVDLAQDYYLVRFSNERDVEYALTEGPWTVMGQYLIVQQWSPSFDVASNKIEKIVAWIRLAEMNIHFYHKNIRRLGEIVGPVVKIDHKTVEAQRGKFARIAVEIDLTKPLISQFNFEGRIQRVEYEYLPTICFDCGKVGHYKDACPDSAKVVPPKQVLPVPHMVAESQAAVETELAGRSETKFGSWMVVVRKPRARKLNAKGIPKNMVTGHQRPIFQDSRFGILDSVNEEESIPDSTAKAVSPNHDEVMPASTSLAFRTKHPKKKNHSHPYRKIPTRLDSSPLFLENPISNKGKINTNIQIRSRSSIPTSSPNNSPIAMQGMLAQNGNLSANPNGVPTLMHGMHENFNDHNTTFPHDPHANQSPMQDMHVISSSRNPMHVPTSLNPLHHSAVSFPKIPKPPNLDKAPSSSRTTRGISLAEGHDNYLDGDPPDNFVFEGENHCRELDGDQSFHSANGKEASISDEDDSVVAESAMDIGAELVGLSH
ncbi:DUF4283 domain-containing protein [Citrus sinensis]|uniref:DUF4283 domain-containing protein n=1 Tax=Citrus sinensis TaxID=2711 RepID=A0ACB8INJ8_CITSI|nr:DUF4283 domain-containing protein [Citrus sinensis]